MLGYFLSATKYPTQALKATSPTYNIPVASTAWNCHGWALSPSVLSCRVVFNLFPISILRN